MDHSVFALLLFAEFGVAQAVLLVAVHFGFSKKSGNRFRASDSERIREKRAVSSQNAPHSSQTYRKIGPSLVASLRNGGPIPEHAA